MADHMRRLFPGPSWAGERSPGQDEEQSPPAGRDHPTAVAAAMPLRMERGNPVKTEIVLGIGRSDKLEAGRTDACSPLIPQVSPEVAATAPYKVKECEPCAPGVSGPLIPCIRRSWRVRRAALPRPLAVGGGWWARPPPRVGRGWSISRPPKPAAAITLAPQHSTAPLLRTCHARRSRRHVGVSWPNRPGLWSGGRHS
jgi:hypothetical protein